MFDKSSKIGLLDIVLKMIWFRKLGIILCSFGLLSNPSFALEDKVLEDIAGDSYKFGFFSGQFTAACGFYQFGLISEENAREFLRLILK